MERGTLNAEAMSSGTRMVFILMYICYYTLHRLTEYDRMSSICNPQTAVASSGKHLPSELELAATTTSFQQFRTQQNRHESLFMLYYS
jgi:hypothetical protein